MLALNGSHTMWAELIFLHLPTPTKLHRGTQMAARTLLSAAELAALGKVVTPVKCSMGGTRRYAQTQGTRACTANLWLTKWTGSGPYL